MRYEIKVNLKTTVATVGFPLHNDPTKVVVAYGAALYKKKKADILTAGIDYKIVMRSRKAMEIQLLKPLSEGKLIVIG